MQIGVNMSKIRFLYFLPKVMKGFNVGFVTLGTLTAEQRVEARAVPESSREGEHFLRMHICTLLLCGTKISNVVAEYTNTKTSRPLPTVA